MGAWGVGIYDNDDAADWVAELEDGGLAVVSAALSTIVDGDYVEAPEGARAVAAADVVARLRSGGGEESPYCDHDVHEGGWTLTLTPDRIATWTRPDGTVYWTGPTTDRVPNGITRPAA